MLEETQGVLPKRFTIVLKDMIEEDVQVNQVNEFFKTHRVNYESFVINGIDKTIAIKVPSIAISIVSIIEYTNSLKFEKSGGNILDKISVKYLKESMKRFIKLISRSIVTTVSNAIVEIINVIVFHDHWGLKYFSKFLYYKIHHTKHIEEVKQKLMNRLPF